MSLNEYTSAELLNELMARHGGNIRPVQKTEPVKDPFEFYPWVEDWHPNTNHVASVAIWKNNGIDIRPDELDLFHDGPSAREFWGSSMDNIPEAKRIALIVYRDGQWKLDANWVKPC